MNDGDDDQAISQSNMQEQPDFETALERQVVVQIVFTTDQRGEFFTRLGFQQWMRVRPIANGLAQLRLWVDGRRAKFQRRGQMFRADRAAAGHQRAVLDGIAQLADVAGPRPAQQLG